MQLALRPYVTTGIAIVGASVIAVAPIVPTPTEIQIPNPVTQLERGVQLTANEIENAFNQLAFVGAQVVTTLAKLPAPLVAQILGIPPEAAQSLLSLVALGFTGSLISGTGATGAAIQDIVDQLGSLDLAGLINALIGAPATLIDGLVNGGYGPDLNSLLGGLSPIPLLAGGLIRGAFPLGSLVLSPLSVVLPGLFPTLQGLVTLLASQLGGTQMLAAAATPLAAPVQTEGQIEGAINSLLFTLVASPIVTVAGLLGPLLAPVIGEEEAALLPVAALGLLGPLISGPGSIGTALQDVVDSLGSGDFAGVLSTLLGAPATVIDGFVNGGYGPDLGPLVSPVPLPFPFRAGGLINEGKLPLLSLPPWKLPGTIPTLQGLVTQILGLLPGAQALTAAAPAATLKINNVDTSNQRLVILDVAPDNTPPGPAAGLTANLPSKAKVPPKVDEIKTAIATEKGLDTGTKVSEAAKPGTDTLDMTEGGKVIPETTVSDGDGDGKKTGGSNPVGSAISSVTKSLAGAVKSALGG
jgi:hypothetical protein